MPGAQGAQIFDIIGSMLYVTLNLLSDLLDSSDYAWSPRSPDFRYYRVYVTKLTLNLSDLAEPSDYAWSPRSPEFRYYRVYVAKLRFNPLSDLVEPSGFAWSPTSPDHRVCGFICNSFVVLYVPLNILISDQMETSDYVSTSNPIISTT